MSQKFHIAPDGVRACLAKKQPCPYGGDEAHYASQAEAEQVFQQQMERQYGQSVTLRQETPDFTSRVEINSAQEFFQLQEENTRRAYEFQVADEEYWAAYERHKATNNGKGAYRAFPVTEEMFQAHERRKAAYYAFALTDVVHNEYAQIYGVDRREMPLTSYQHYEEKQAAFERWKAQQNAGTEGLQQGGYTTGEHDPNPSMNEDRHFNKAVNTMGAFTGKKPWTVREEIEAIQQQRGVDRHEAMLHFYRNAELRKDKPLLFIDLETAARPMEDVGTVDDGQYADIIEVGYMKQYPDGRVEEDSFLLDADPNLKAGFGTGAQNIHNISPEMIAGKPRFSDPAIQRKMQQTIKDSVIVAHNANFENTQFSWNLRGYAHERAQFNVETLDTKDIATYFVKTVNGNRNKDFVETAGIEYGESAHRALYDVKINKQAFETVIKDREKYLRGDHEQNAKLRAAKEAETEQ